VTFLSGLKDRLREGLKRSQEYLGSGLSAVLELLVERGHVAVLELELGDELLERRHVHAPDLLASVEQCP